MGNSEKTIIQNFWISENGSDSFRERIGFTGPTAAGAANWIPYRPRRRHDHRQDDLSIRTDVPISALWQAWKSRELKLVRPGVANRIGRAQAPFMMSPCTFCGLRVSTDARVCPNCGMPDPTGMRRKRRKYWVIAIAILTLLIVVLAWMQSH